MQEPRTELDIASMLSQRTLSIDASGIRRIFELGVKLKDPINLSIGQPDFPVPREIKDAVIEAIESDRNGYTVTQGEASVLAVVREHLAEEMDWDVDDETIGGEDLGRAHETGDVRHLEAHKGAPRCEARAIFGARERGRGARALSTSDAQMMRRWRARPTAFVPCHRAPSASARASVSHGSGLRCRTDKSRAATS